MSTLPLPEDPSLKVKLSLEGYPYEFLFIPHNRLILDTVEGPIGNLVNADTLLRYQRLQDSVSKRIRKDGFQELRFLPLVVNRRANHVYSIGDGGGRYRAIDAYVQEGLLPKEQPIPCLVTQIPLWDEPLWFVSLNREKLGLNQVDVFLAKAAAGDQEATKILEIVTDSGLRIQSGSGARVIRAVDALYGAYRTSTGEEDLRRTLRLLRESGWDDRPKGLSGGSINGLSRIVQLHNPQHTDEYLVSALAETTPGAVYHDAINTTPSGGGSRLLGKGYALVLATHINKVHRARINSRRYINPTQFWIDRSEKAATAKESPSAE